MKSLDFPKNFIKIIPLNEIQDHFDISGVYRIKRSGTSDLSKIDIIDFKKVISKKFERYVLETKDRKTYLITNEEIKYLYLGKGRYFLSKETNNTYRVKKRSITRNSNVIFTLKFNPIDHIDDGLKKLEDTLMQGI